MIDKHWLDMLLGSVGLQRTQSLEELEPAEASIITYLDLVATNLETAALAVRRIAKRLRDLRQEMEDADG